MHASYVKLKNGSIETTVRWDGGSEVLCFCWVNVSTSFLLRIATFQAASGNSEALILSAVIKDSIVHAPGGPVVHSFVGLFGGGEVVRVVAICGCLDSNSSWSWTTGVFRTVRLLLFVRWRTCSCSSSVHGGVEVVVRRMRFSKICCGRLRGQWWFLESLVSFDRRFNGCWRGVVRWCTRTCWE